MFYLSAFNPSPLGPGVDKQKQMLEEDETVVVFCCSVYFLLIRVYTYNHFLELAI